MWVIGFGFEPAIARPRTKGRRERMPLESQPDMRQAKLAAERRGEGAGGGEGAPRIVPCLHALGGSCTKLPLGALGPVSVQFFG